MRMKISGTPNYFRISVIIWALFIVLVLAYKTNAEDQIDNEYDTGGNINDVIVVVGEETLYDLPIETPSTYLEISPSDRECLSYIISGEAWAEPIEGKMAVAQCLLNAMRQDGLSAEEVREKYQYAGWKTNLEEVDPENWEQVLEAIERVFDNGETVTDENIMWFYAPKYCTSKWHETQKYVGTFGTQRFFAPND